MDAWYVCNLGQTWRRGFTQYSKKACSWPTPWRACGRRRASTKCFYTSFLESLDVLGRVKHFFGQILGKPGKPDKRWWTRRFMCDCAETDENASLSGLDLHPAMGDNWDACCEGAGRTTSYFLDHSVHTFAGSLMLGFGQANRCQLFDRTGDCQKPTGITGKPVYWVRLTGINRSFFHFGFNRLTDGEP